MVPLLELENKTDRELLLLTASTVDALNEKLTAMCKVVNQHEDNIVALSTQTKADRWLMRGGLGGLLALIGAVFGILLAHLGIKGG